MNSIATPEPVIAAAIFVSVAGVVLLSMLGFLIRWLIKEPVGVMLLHYHPTKVQGRTLLGR